jgi:protein-tyrosine phosphatase
MSFLFLTPQYLRDPPAFFHTRILVGPGSFLTPAFAEKYNITHVINCAHNDFSPVWWRTQFPDKYTLIEAVDSVQVNILDWYPEFEKTLHQYLREGDGVVYVHCHAGMNRSASLALAYTSKNMGMDLEELVASVRRQRPCILQNPVFMNQVREFVNGRVQDSQDKGTQFIQHYDRYARFFTPGNYTRAEGYEDQTGDSQTRSRRFTGGNITPLFYE